jgi:hypothetical protein
MEVERLADFNTNSEMEAHPDPNIRALINSNGDPVNANHPTYRGYHNRTRARVLNFLRREWRNHTVPVKPNKTRCLLSKQLVDGFDPIAYEDREPDDKACKLAKAMCHPAQPDTFGPLAQDARGRMVHRMIKDDTGASHQSYREIEAACKEIGQRYPENERQNWWFTEDETRRQLFHPDYL